MFIFNFRKLQYTLLNYFNSTVQSIYIPMASDNSRALQALNGMIESLQNNRKITMERIRWLLVHHDGLTLNADFVALLEKNNQSLHQLRASIYLAFKPIRQTISIAITKGELESGQILEETGDSGEILGYDWELTASVENGHLFLTLMFSPETESSPQQRIDIAVCSRLISKGYDVEILEPREDISYSDWTVDDPQQNRRINNMGAIWALCHQSSLFLHEDNRIHMSVEFTIKSINLDHLFE